MSLFSYRQGLKKKREIFQNEDLDQLTKNKIWSYYSMAFLSNPNLNYGVLDDRYDNKIYPFVRIAWLDYFGQPIDTLPRDWEQIYGFIRESFYNCKWHELYDWLEFTMEYFPDREAAGRFAIMINYTLEEQLVSYRVVAQKITQITSNEEIQAIEDATDNKHKGARTHIVRSLELLSDKKKPDYRNSVKESISAVEAIAKTIAKNEKATLGEALKIIDKDSKMHGAFKEALNKLYGYTSDEKGIRHSLLEEDAIDFADAKYMLVSCAAFVNYLTAKHSKL